jgi:hypothetical protein
MNVRELREALDNLPGHLPVHVAVNSDHDNGGGADTDYLYTLDVQRDNFPTQGNMAVIRIDYGGGASALEDAWLRERRKYPKHGGWERRQAWGDGARVLHWGNWNPCTEAEANRVTGLRSWEVRRVGSALARGVASDVKASAEGSNS